MAQKSKGQKKIEELKKEEELLQSALKDQVGCTDTLQGNLRNVQTQLKRLRQQVSEHQKGPIWALCVDLFEYKSSTLGAAFFTNCQYWAC